MNQLFLLVASCVKDLVVAWNESGVSCVFAFSSSASVAALFVGSRRAWLAGSFEHTLVGSHSQHEEGFLE